MRRLVLGVFLAGCLVSASAWADQQHHKPTTRAVWVLMLLEHHGEKVTVGGVFRTKDAAQKFGDALPIPAADRFVLPVPATYYKGAK